MKKLELPDSVFSRRMQFDEKKAAEWKALLSPEEQKRLSNFPQVDRQQEFLTGRVAARTLLAEHLNASPDEVDLAVTASGAVKVSKSPWRISLSHSNSLVIACCARHPVGVDIEVRKERSPRLQRFIVHDAENPQTLFPDCEKERLVLMWVIKEAVLKARETGLRTMPNKLAIGAVNGQQAYVQDQDGMKWKVQFAIEKNFCLAVAYPREVNSD